MENAEDIALMAHLMRRAGFGASRSEIEALAEKGYEETVEWLLRPEEQPEIDEYALFWHHVFATGNSKVGGANAMTAQIDMFREHGMGSYRELLVELAKSPAMIKWLDNDENHKRAPNENWGRELLELFSMGVGHYTEKDVYECARAFPGWTYDGKISFVFGAFPWQFTYKAEDHDAGEKTFLGHTGRFNGEDIIDIVVQQAATHRFIVRHLYNFFVADEPQVPAWPVEPAKDEAAIDTLSAVFVDSGFEMRPVLRTLFNSETFGGLAYFSAILLGVDLIFTMVSTTYRHTIAGM